MSIEKEIRKEANRIWKEKGCRYGYADEDWAEAEIIYWKRQNLKLILYIFILLAIVPLFELMIGSLKLYLIIIPSVIFALTILFLLIETRARYKVFLWRQILALITIYLFFIVFLDFERKSGTFQSAHQILVNIVFILTVLFVTINGLWPWFRDFLGFEKPLTNNAIFRLEFEVLAGFIISIYLLLGNQSQMPLAFQFSIIPVTATLGGLVISGANYYSENNKERRLDLLRVAQKLIIATVIFIFFVSAFSVVGNSYQPDQFNSATASQVEWIKYVFFWIASLLFYLGTFLFVAGIIDLTLSLKSLKNN